MDVQLTLSEISTAANVGVRRRLASLAQSLRDKGGVVKHEWEMDIIGAIGELSVAKGLGLYWPAGVNTWKLPDVGALHVRTTTHADGRLLIRPNDGYGIYILVVVGRVGQARLAGWIDFKDVRNPEWFTQPDANRPGCWAIPQSALKPMSELKKEST